MATDSGTEMERVLLGFASILAGCFVSIIVLFWIVVIGLLVLILTA